MILTVTLILVLIAMGLTIASTWNPPKAPLWIAVLLLVIVHLIALIPIK